jgi:hypothetical protein
LPVWELIPLDLTDANWEASSHRGRVIVRAPDEDAARNEAEKAFGVKTRFRPGTGVKAPPWKRSGLVKASMIEDTRYEDEGPTEVLFPEL